MNHQNRNRPKTWTPPANPTPAQVREARERAGLTQIQAEAVVHVFNKGRTWRKWEAGEQRMHPAIFGYFLKSEVCAGSASPWIPVTEQIPKTTVIAFVQNAFGQPGCTRRIRAQYAEKFALEQHEDMDGGDYDEKTDTVYAQEGWYETNEFEEIHYHVDGDVTHWMALPDEPKG